MSKPLLKVAGLDSWYGESHILHGVNLQIKRGSIHALIGPNGAGKTTVFNLLTKFLPVSSGQIIYNGQDITALKAAEVARMGMVRSFQISAVFPHLSVLENVRIGLQRKLGTSFHFWKSQDSLNSLNAQAMHLLEQVDLASFAQTATVELPLKSPALRGFLFID
jgi:branched-chain amino acid transport system ATP-binding protein